MITPITLALISSWSYADFLAKPGPPVPTPTAVAARPPEAPADPWTRKILPTSLVEPTAPPEPPPAKLPAMPPPRPESASRTADCACKTCLCDPCSCARPVAKVAPPPPVAPQVWQLADAAGTNWQHPDPAYLRSFVEARNRSFTVAAPAYRYQAGSACATGRCPR